jgi:opacity protein-like surface antigen
MRKLTAAAIALASTVSVPVFAQDVGPYVGVDAGVMFPRDIRYNGLNNATAPVTGFSDPYRVDLNTGFDGDINAGYDFGMFRLEVEGGYKRASVNAANTLARNPAQPFATRISDGHNQVYSLMANALVDIGPENGVNFFAGGGAGVAWNKANYNFASTNPGLAGPVEDNDSAFAWQLIAGVRVPVSPSVDVSLKYRYFDAGRFHYDDDLAGVSSRFRSHSVLAGLSFKFGRSAPVEEVAPPPPPPPPAPAPEYTPPPPPPPPPAPTRGERG